MDGYTVVAGGLEVIEVIREFFLMLSNSGHRVMLTTTSMVFFWLFAGWSFGVLPALGAGFAKAEDVSAVQAQLLENAIIEARIRYCTAPPGTPMKQFFLKAVNGKMGDYKELTGSDYPLPLCEELVVAAN